MKKLTQITTSIIIIATLLAITCAHTVFAVDPVPEELNTHLENLRASVPELSMTQCQEIVKIYDIEILKFLKFLEENFQNKSSTTSLTNIAIVAYSEYKHSLKTTFAKFTPKYSTSKNAGDFETNYQNYEKCAEITDSYIKYAKQEMMKYIKNNSTQKTTTMLLEKYHSINERLRDLNMAVAEMYSYFATFKNKLPGFLNECITSP